MEVAIRRRLHLQPLAVSVGDVAMRVLHIIMHPHPLTVGCNLITTKEAVDAPIAVIPQPTITIHAMRAEDTGTNKQLVA